MAGFPKGKSGNPGGRPKIAKALAELGKTTGGVTKELLEIAFEVLKNKPKGGNDANWRYAHEFLSNHIIGKPKDTVVHEFGDGDDEDEEVDLSKMSNRELDDYIARKKAEVAAAAAAATRPPEPVSAPAEDDGDSGAE